MPPRAQQRTRRRGQRGAVASSPIALLSIVTVIMVAASFVLTREAPPAEREIATIALEPSPSATPTTAPAPEPPKRPAIKRDKVLVEVYNNSNETGLASRVAARTAKVGWQVVGTDNWYGTVDATTVYYPKRLKAEARQLALDLGIRRTAPAIDPMRLDRLTVILTGAL
jgi:hypothetical protein